MSALILIAVAIVIVIVLFIAMDYFAGAIGGDGRLWLALKGLVVIIALVFVLQRTGYV